MGTAGGPDHQQDRESSPGPRLYVFATVNGKRGPALRHEQYLRPRRRRMVLRSTLPQ